MLKDRCFITLLIAGLAIGLRAWSNGAGYAGLPPTSFWKAKLEKTGSADVVVAGDSRIYRGVATDELENATAAKVANFGFSGAGLDDEFLDVAQGMLGDSGSRILVLGVTPYSLTPGAAAHNGFKDHAKHYGESLNGFKIWLDQIEARLPATEFVELRRGLKSLFQRSGEPKTFYHRNGWAEYRPTKIESAKTKKTLEHQAKLYRENKVSEEMQTALLERVQHWAEQGIKVFAFRPPVIDAMTETENHLSGFDEMEFRQRFEAAGGTWLEIDDTGLIVYDGSHLTGESAVEFTRRLGRELKQLD